MILDKVTSPADLKKIPVEKLSKLAQEIREVLINKASNFGGHLGSNLGVVELTIALHYVFESPKDKIVFDVSHQCYVHKILTGRKAAFLDEKLYSSVSGYTNPKESEHDMFNVGHTSTSISLACGLAKGRDICKRTENIIAVIGDAALDGGEAFEALNSAVEVGGGLIVVVNDNDMSIPENHGALCKHLATLREHDGKYENNFFEALGFEYRFVKAGHNVAELIDAFSKVKDATHPVVVHCVTEKGKGYIYAEKDREKWHHAHPFNIDTGEFLRSASVPAENYGSIVGKYLMERIKSDPRVVAMTASVPTCFGFNPDRRKEAGKQYIDVGIAEQNLITMATGLAKSGCKPVTITESSFYQRAYDQIEQELCINRCAVTMLIAFSGIFAHTDNTHIGLYDIALLGNIPGLIYLAPSNKQEYLAMLEWSIEQNENPVAIRIPWNGVHYINTSVPREYSETKYWVRKEGSRIAVLGLGSFYQLAEQVCELIKKDMQIDATLIDPLFITGVDKPLLEKLKRNHQLIVTLEDGIVSGGFGARISQFYGATDMKVINCGFHKEVPTQFTVEDMMKSNGLMPEQILYRIKEIFNYNDDTIADEFPITAQ